VDHDYLSYILEVVVLMTRLEYKIKYDLDFWSEHYIDISE